MYQRTVRDSWLVYYVILGALFVATVILFIAFFFITDEGFLFAREPDPDQSVVHYEQTPENTELQAQIDQLTAERQILQSELNSQYLILVDASNPLPEDYVPSGLVEVEANPAMKLETMTELMLRRFLSAAREAGYVPILLHAYMDAAEQQALFDATVQDYMNAGYTRTDAEIKAAMDVARPYSSDHMTGLSVDIVDKTDSDGFIEYAKQHIHEYGFVLGYPEGKENVTGMNYSPEHFRYVGDSARAIYEKGMTLSEYRFYLNQQIQLKTEMINSNTKKLEEQT